MNITAKHARRIVAGIALAGLLAVGATAPAAAQGWGFSIGINVPVGHGGHVGGYTGGYSNGGYSNGGYATGNDGYQGEVTRRQARRVLNRAGYGNFDRLYWSDHHWVAEGRNHNNQAWTIHIDARSGQIVRHFYGQQHLQPMGRREVASLLYRLGYPDIRRLREHNEVWSARVRDSYGQRWRIRIDGRTGQVIEQTPRGRHNAGGYGGYSGGGFVGGGYGH